ncbi:MAG: aldo/keto reductase [Clostridia bacterium]|nr:aldo/keto reductase [Clostridia bacterium]
MGPLQANLSLGEGSEIMAHAFRRGINFVDTAQLYETYEYIRLAALRSGVDPVVSTKSYAYDEKQAAKALEEARRMLDRDVIDIFMLHEQESRLTLRGHRDALEFYMGQKALGRIRAVGVSTHNVEVVDAAAGMDGIDVIHPIFNKKGIGIGDGGANDMEKAIEKASAAGKGIFSMKPLGGGNMINIYREAMEYVLGNNSIHSVAVGMRSVAEVEMNIAVFNGVTADPGIQETVSLQNRKLHIESWCEKCGNCIRRCRQEALSMKDGRIAVDAGRCVLCGYCCAVCPVFAIKVF